MEGTRGYTLDKQLSSTRKSFHRTPIQLHKFLDGSREPQSTPVFYFFLSNNDVQDYTTLYFLLCLGRMILNFTRYNLKWLS